MNQSNTNDNWRLETTGGEAFWERNKKVRLQHVDTGVYLWCGLRPRVLRTEGAAAGGGRC